MSALAARAAPVFHASVGDRPFLKRQRGAACREMSREKFAARRAVATESSAPPGPTRACRGFDVKIREEGFSAAAKEPAVRASASERLKQRVDAERDTLGILCKKAARLLSGEASRSGNTQPKSTSSAEAAARVRKSTPSKPASDMRRQSTEPKKQQPAVQRAAAGTTEISMASRLDQAKEAMEKRRQAEIARAREKFRLELLEVAKAAMPDETIYPEDLKELGITYQYAMTRTRKQAEDDVE